MAREWLFPAFFFTGFALLLWQLVLFLRPFFAPLVWAAILALTLWPLNVRLGRLLGGRRTLCACILLVLVIAALLLPALFFGALLVQQASEAYVRLERLAGGGDLARLVEAVATSQPGRIARRLIAPFENRIEIRPSELVLGATRWLSEQIVGQAGALARNVLLTVLYLALMLVALFFFFRDGARIGATVRDLLPMDPEHKTVLFRRVADTVSAAVQSVLLTAAAQGLLGGLGYAFIARLDVPIFLGFVTALASFLPVIGGAAVWLPVVGYLLAVGDGVRAGGLLAWGLLVMGMADNVIRPLVIGGRVRIPTVLLLFALLGGLQVYGFLGIILAPAIVALLLGFVEIYRELYGPGVPRPAPAAPAVDTPLPDRYGA